MLEIVHAFLDYGFEWIVIYFLQFWTFLMLWFLSKRIFFLYRKYTVSDNSYSSYLETHVRSKILLYVTETGSKFYNFELGKL
jgi:hypothetical protein